jgi:hypothetical protein
MENQHMKHPKTIVTTCIEFCNIKQNLLQHRGLLNATSPWSLSPASCAITLKLLRPPSSNKYGPPSSHAAGVLPCPELRVDAAARMPDHRELHLSELHQGRSFCAAA